MSYKSHIS